MRLAVVGLALAAGLAAGSCGDDDGGAGGAGPTATERTESPTLPTATAPSATQPPPETTEPPVAPTPAPDPEAEPGGAGDEEAARVPVAFIISGDEGLTPPTVAVPAFLALDITLRNETARRQTLVIRGAGPPNRIVAEAGRSRRIRHPGLRAGSYRVDAGTAGDAVLVVGAEPGP